uniref:UDP-glucose:glycoprotein glucosyltransferase 2 n=1 Tax=Panthera onca TaxID=9690 RepID=UPI0029541285|nr:UDP-glucose:glycoprotein glucosyltransferase 2 [Panthera onca]
MAKATDVVRLLLGSTALCFSLLDARTASASKSVTAHLAAKWPETPLLLEARWVRAGPSAEPSAEGGSAGSLGPDLAVCRPSSSLSAAGAPSCWALEHPLHSGYPVRGAHLQFLFLAVHTLPHLRFLRLQGLCLIRLDLIQLPDGVQVWSKEVQRPSGLGICDDLKRSLTRIAVNHLMREEIQENQKGLHARFEIQPGDACLFINGLRVDMSAYDSFRILDMLKLEGKIMNGLHNLGISKEDTSKFLKLKSHVWDHTYALDIRHSSIMWINDLENDDLYVTWPTSCQELLKPVFPGTVPSIRRNFHNLVLFIDPAQEYTLDFIKLAELLYYHKIPLRIGFVFVVNTDDEVDGADDVGVALWRAFNYIAEEQDVSQAFISVVHMYQKVKNDNVLTVDNVKSVLNVFPDANIWDILGIHSKYDNDRKVSWNVILKLLLTFRKVREKRILRIYRIENLRLSTLPAITEAGLCDSVSAENKKSRTVWIFGVERGPLRASCSLCRLSASFRFLCSHPPSRIRSVSSDDEKYSCSVLSAQGSIIIHPGHLCKKPDGHPNPLLRSYHPKQYRVMFRPSSQLNVSETASFSPCPSPLISIERTVTAEYELEYLLLEGHCFDTMTEQPPRGLQFTLSTKSKPVLVDTIVMANLGYFQLKANPGAWILKLRQGKSEDIYQIVGHEGTDSQPDLGDVIVVINSFKSKILEVQVQKKPDKIKEDLLTDKDEKKKGMWDSIKSFTRSLHKEKDEADVLNIFSVASGHLYERFLRIMMLSVLRNTKTPVKFWFLKNYLSPTFKEVIPHMAEEYGFQYELVQYQWPRWLHQQTEKQRIIWGYKILFLDVLFPLAVDKIIFVDADQIVRHDLKELRDFDLDGAPYGYTPFCDSRTEMDGYRFWKKGYWASHLLRRKYHISALYVVDLKQFRRIAAGDRLRGQYQALSQDPNSLSNLDQDLPNNMIYQVAIKSLPQDWLWCETWCDDESKQRAKTIDLCNNPKTKEPKLKAAARIVPEWVEYDTEIRQLLEHLENKKKNAILTHDEL